MTWTGDPRSDTYPTCGDTLTVRAVRSKCVFVASHFTELHGPSPVTISMHITVSSHCEYSCYSAFGPFAPSLQHLTICHTVKQISTYNNIINVINKANSLLQLMQIMLVVNVYTDAGHVSLSMDVGSKNGKTRKKSANALNSYHTFNTVYISFELNFHFKDFD